MSDSQSSPFFSTVGQGLQGFANDVAYDPATLGLLNAGANLAAAGAPSRLPVPFGLAFSQGALGFGQGTQQALKNQQAREQLRTAQLNNTLNQAMLPAKMQLLGSVTGGSGGGAGGGIPFGMPGVPPSSGGAGGASAQASGAASSPYLMPPQDLVNQARLAMATGQDRAAAAIYSLLGQQAGGNGYTWGQNGTALAVPGGAKDPNVIYQTSNAEAAGKVGPELQAYGGRAAIDTSQAGPRAGAVAGAQAPYQPPVTVQMQGADGVYHDVQIPRPAWAGQNSAPAPASQMPGPSGRPYSFNPQDPATPAALATIADPAVRRMVPVMAQAADVSVPVMVSVMHNEHGDLLNNPQINNVPNGSAGEVGLMQVKPATGASVGITPGSLGQMDQNLLAGARYIRQNIDAAGGNLDAGLSGYNTGSPSKLNPAYVAPIRQRLQTWGFGGSPAQPGQPAPGPQSAQPTVAGAPPGAIVGRPVMTPEQQTASTGLGTLQNQIMDAGSKAPVGLQRLAVIDNAAQGFRPGLTGDARLTAARAVTDGLQSIGITPPAWIANGAAAGETIGKEGGYLATELTRSLGSREALGVFNQVRNISPNIEMSNGGFQVVTNSIRQGLMRDQDLANFQDQWVQNPAHGGSIRGMTQAFEQSHPMEAYASRVVPFPLPKSQAAAQPNVIYNTARGPALWDGKQFQAITPGAAQ